MIKIELEEGNNKFIHFKEGKNEGIVSKNMTWHRQIFDSMKDEISENSILGGGRIKLDKKEKNIEVYGFSGSYGGTNQTYLKEVLQNQFGSEYTITTGDEKLSEQKLQRETKKTTTLESIISNQNIQGLFNKLPANKKVRLYRETGINKLTRDEVKSYIINSLEGHDRDFDEVTSLIQEFNLQTDEEMKKEFLSGKATKFIEKDIEFRGGYDAYTRFNGKVPTLNTLKEYLSKLERFFPVSKGDVQPLVQTIIDNNMKNIEKSHTEYEIPLLEESQTLATEFNLEQSLIAELIERKVSARLNKLQHINDEEELVELKSAIKELPEDKQKTYVNEQAVEFMKKNKVSGEDYFHPMVGIEFAYTFLTNFGENLNDKQYQFIEEGLKENACEFIKSREMNIRFIDRNKDSQEQLLMLKKIVDYNPSIAGDVTLEFNNQVEELARYLLEREDNDCSFDYLLESDIITRNQFNNIVKQQYINLATEGKVSERSKVFRRFGINESDEIEVYETALNNIANSEILTPSDAHSFLKIAISVQKLKSENSEVITNNYKTICDLLQEEERHYLDDVYKLVSRLGDTQKQDDIVKAVINNSSEQKPNEYIHNVVYFFKKQGIDISKYKSELQSGLTTSFGKEKMTDEEIKLNTHLLNFKLGMQTKERTKQLEYLLQNAVNRDIEELDLKPGYTKRHYLDSFIKEHNLSSEEYMPKINVLINATIENGYISRASSLASSYNHPYKEELKVLEDIL